MFDANSFLSTQYDASNSTTVPPVPEGEYTGAVSKMDFRELTRNDGSETVIADLTWDVVDSDGSIKASTGREKPQVRQTIWLDLIPGTKNLDMSEGKNVGLGRLREALGQNNAGKPWGFSMVPGVSARILVSHRANKDTGEVYGEVKKVGAL